LLDGIVFGQDWLEGGYVRSYGANPDEGDWDVTVALSTSTNIPIIVSDHRNRMEAFI
jgi:hypothetical protein